MSLINDALKRASKTDRNRPRQVEQPLATLKPVADQSPSPVGLVLAAGIVLALVFGGWFFWQFWHASHLPAPIKNAPVAGIEPRPEPPPGVTEVVSAPSAPASTPATANAQTSAPPVQAKSAEEAWPAELKLNAIIFSKANPMVMINGKTVGVGDVISNIRVTKIERDRVSVEWNGQAKVLVMK